VYDCVFDFALWARVQTPLTQAGYMIDDISYADAVRVRFLIHEGSEARFLEQARNLTLGQSVPELKGTRLTERSV
jgi:hypothetical protein